MSSALAVGANAGLGLTDLLSASHSQVSVKVIRGFFCDSQCELFC